jgi:hypothetical protein
VWLNLFTALVFVVAAATAISIALLVWALAQLALQPGAPVDAVIKAGVAVVSAIGTFVTGKATTFLVDRRNAASAEVETSKGWVSEFCPAADVTAAVEDPMLRPFRLL